jgi:hypothetical protein
VIAYVVFQNACEKRSELTQESLVASKDEDEKVTTSAGKNLAEQLARFPGLQEDVRLAGKEEMYCGPSELI